MVTIEQLYAATDAGLEIVCYYYPTARAVAGTKNHFKLRADERTASATLRLKNGGKYGQVWKVTDFGDEGRELSPLDICMKEEGLKRINEAILLLAARHGVKADQISQTLNRCEWDERPATAEERDGTLVFSFLPEIPEEHLRVLGPNVKREHVEALHWYEAEWVGWVKNRMVKLKKSNAHYPIFMRECCVDERDGAKGGKFYKIYEPLNFDKKFRFSYSTADERRGLVSKPRNYINGLSELALAQERFNAEEEARFTNDPRNEGKAFKARKLDEVIICSGERDALCCRSMGYHPVWFNSETYDMTDEDYKQLTRYAETVYNIPDLDDTGRRRGAKLALRHIDVATIWLPQQLAKYADNRGRPRKDLRDWMEIYDRKKDFDELVEVAIPARFWFEEKNSKGKPSFTIDSECLFYFLKLNGFATYTDPFSEEVMFVHVEGSVVKRCTPRDIRQFVVNWAREQNIPRAARNAIINTPRISDASLDNLQQVQLDFTSATRLSQLFFFDGETVEVTPEGLKLHGKEGAAGAYVWSKKVVPHRFREMPPMFSTTSHEGPRSDAPREYSIKIEGAVASPMMGYLVNASRLFWRKELEEQFANDANASRCEAYKAAHRFSLDGEGLTDEERAMQHKSFLNKVFATGYMLHRFKSPSMAWAPFAMDNKIGETMQANGRSGKSLLFKLLSNLGLYRVKISGRDPRGLESEFLFDQVTKDTDYIVFDDCSAAMRVDRFYDTITDDLNVNPKNGRHFSIPFEESPKFVFTTNYVPTDFDASSTARMLYLVFSDYYHEQAESNDYLETRSVRDDFGFELMGRQYTEDQWNADLNFLLQCCRFYLQVISEGVQKLQPPMQNIITRKYKADMGDAFEDWAATYFGEDGGRLDTLVCRREALEDFASFSNQRKITMQRFTRSLKAFVELCPYVYELNPPALCNSQGRIVRKTGEDGKSEEFIYLRSMKAEQRGVVIAPEAQFHPAEEGAPF